MQPTLDRNTIDRILSLADFGERTFVCNDGAEYDGNNAANAALYLTSPELEDADSDSESECHSLEVKIVDGKFSIQCPVMTNVDEVETDLNSELTDSITEEI